MYSRVTQRLTSGVGASLRADNLIGYPHVGLQKDAAQPCIPILRVGWIAVKPSFRFVF